MLLQRLASVEAFHPEALPIAVYALGVIGLGLIDDTLGDDPAGEAGWPGARYRAAGAATAPRRFAASSPPER